MTKNSTKYKRFSKGSLFSVQTAYLSSDHLLVLDGHYIETRRQLAYEDIEAILISPNKSKGGGWALCWGILSFIFLLLGLAQVSNSWAAAAGLFVWVPMFGLIAFSIINGGGAVLFGVKTGVQTVVIRGINTRKKADKAMQLLTEIIEEKQGKLTMEVLEQAKRKLSEEDLPQAEKRASISLQPKPEPANESRQESIPE